MKKRRELDALVTNGKLPRRKSKSGHELLRSNDSDSSEVEEFSVQIGSKTGKKWIGICPCSSCVALLVFIVMTSCLIACGGLIWMHFELKRDLDNIRERLLTVENRNQGDPEEFQRYHSQIQELNKTVHNIQAGDKGINKISQNLTQVATQLQDLKKVTDGLKVDLQKAPLLKDLPTRIESLTSTVAKIGSDVQNAKTQIEGFDDFKKKTLAELEDLKQRVANVENRTKSSPGEGLAGRERGSVVPTRSDSGQWTQQIQMLSEDIDTLNRSLKAQLHSLNSSLLTHETRLSLLEKFTAKTPSAAGLDKEAIAQALEEVLNGEDAEGLDSGLLSGINERMDNITAMITTMAHLYQKLEDAFNDVKSYTVKSPAPASGVEILFRMFQAETLSNLEYLNSSVLTTNEHVEQLFKIFTQNRNELNNVTAKLNGLVSYLSVQMNGSSTTDSTKGGQSTTTTATSTTTKPPSSTTQAKTTSAPKEEEDAAPTITMKLVHTVADLEKIFPNWDRRGEGQVDPDDLEGFMPDPPSKEQLKPFDVDNNGKYSLEEMKAALGFTSDTATEEVKHIFE